MVIRNDRIARIVASWPNVTEPYVASDPFRCFDEWAVISNQVLPQIYHIAPTLLENGICTIDEDGTKTLSPDVERYLRLLVSGSLSSTKQRQRRPTR